MELKKLTAADRPAIRSLFLDVFSNAPWNDDWSDEAQLDAYLDDLTGNRNSLSLGFFDGERLIALALGNIRHWFRGTEYYIDELCVARSLQGQGVGTAFLAEIERYLSARNIPRIFLQTGRTVPAYSFYLKRGFTELPDHVSLFKAWD